MNKTIQIMAGDKNWHAVEIKENSEKKIAGLLLRKNIETYLPLNKISRKHWDGSLSVVEAPLFPSLLFVNITENEIDLVKQSDSFLHFLYWKGSYAIVSREDIRAIREFSNEHETMWIEKCQVSLEHLTEDNPSGRVKKFIYQEKNKMVASIFLCSLGYNLVAFAREPKVSELHHAS